MNVAEAIKRPYDNFTAIRLALAVAVVISHAFSVGTGRHIDEPLTVLTGYTLGEHGVNGFFAVSGFLVAMSWDRRGGAIPFALARLLRVFPGLIVAVLVTALVIGGAMTTQALGSYLADGRVWRMIWVTITTFKSATVLPGVFEGNPLRWPISTVWTLRYELICYGGLLAYGVLGGFRRPVVMLAGAGAAALALVVLAALGPVPKGQETALRLPLIFACGSLAYLYRDRLPLLPWLAVAAVAVPGFAKLAMPALYAPVLFVGSAYLFCSSPWRPACRIRGSNRAGTSRTASISMAGRCSKRCRRCIRPYRAGSCSALRWRSRAGRRGVVAPGREASPRPQEPVHAAALKPLT